MATFSPDRHAAWRFGKINARNNDNEYDLSFIQNAIFHQAKNNSNKRQLQIQRGAAKYLLRNRLSKLTLTVSREEAQTKQLRVAIPRSKKKGKKKKLKTYKTI